MDPESGAVDNGAEAAPGRRWWRRVSRFAAEAAMVAAVLSLFAPWLWIGALLQRGAVVLVPALVGLAIVHRRSRLLAGGCLVAVVVVAAPFYRAGFEDRAPSLANRDREVGVAPDAPRLRIAVLDARGADPDAGAELSAALAAIEADCLVVTLDPDPQLQRRIDDLPGFDFEATIANFAPLDAGAAGGVADQRPVIGYWQVLAARRDRPWSRVLVDEDPRAGIGLLSLAGPPEVEVVIAIVPPLASPRGFAAWDAIAHQVATMLGPPAEPAKPTLLLVPATWMPSGAPWWRIRRETGLQRPAGGQARPGPAWLPTALRVPTSIIASRGLALGPARTVPVPGCPRDAVVIEISAAPSADGG